MTYLKQIFATQKIVRCFLFASIPAAIFYSVALVGMWMNGFDIMHIVRDPAQQSGQSSFLGFLSNIGIWLWVSSTAICFFSAITGPFSNNKAQRELLILAGLLSMILAVDDFFMIHDRYINQKICYLAYAICAGTLLLRHHKLIVEIAGFAFLTAGALLALSILTDLTQNYIPLDYAHVQVFEEGFKFIGAATWLYFTSSVASFRRSPSEGLD